MNLVTETSLKVTEIFSHGVEGYQQINYKLANNPYRRHANQYESDSWERSGIECLTRDPRATGSSLTGGTALCP